MSMWPSIAGILMIYSGFNLGIRLLNSSIVDGVVTVIAFIYMLIAFAAILYGYNSTKRKGWKWCIAIVILLIIGPGLVLHFILNLFALIILVLSKSEFDKIEKDRKKINN